MPTYTYPGVYVQEVPKGPGPVQSASASTCAMVGFTEEGLVNEPTLVTSFPEFTSKFGSFTSGGRLPTAAFAYFQNGGQNLIVVRTVGTGAAKSSGVIAEPVVAEDAQINPAPDGVLTTFVVSLAESPVIPGTLSLSLGGVVYSDDGQGGIVDQGDVSRGTIDYVTGEINLTTALAPAGGTTPSADYHLEAVRFEAKSEGSWANDVSILIEGDANTAVNNEFTLFNVSVQRADADGRLADVEVFNGVDFTRGSANFIETRLNDSRRGSDLVVVRTGSTVGVPADLSDVSTTEVSAPVGLLNGINRAFTLQTNQAPVVRDTLSGTWHLGTSRTYGAGVVAGAIAPVLDISGESHASVTVTTSLGDAETFSVTQTGAVGTPIVEAFTVAPGDAAAILEGNFNLNPTTGSWTVAITFQGTGNPAITGIEVEFVRANALKFKDDGAGEIILDPAATIDADVSLLPAGPNSINYQTGEISLVVDIAGAGPLNLISANSVALNYTSVNASTSFSTALSGGANGAGLLRSDVSAPALAADELGLFSLNRREELLNVCIPDFAANELVSQDLIDYCETRKDRFAIISVPEGYSYTEAIDYKRNVLLRNSNRAAIYYPHLKVVDPVTENEINFPAVAHMAGIYARTDSVKNVSKAPAGTVDGRISFATGLEVELTPQQAGFVNQANVNNLVSWSYTGLVAWGARTLETNGDFPYIQMRRLFMFVEKSVFNSTQGYVFESNTAGLRAAIKLQIEAFLLGLHRSGHFAGNSPAQSFFVVCDSSNNPQAAIDQGQLVVDVGIAPTKPAEFIIFRFQQKTVD